MNDRLNFYFIAFVLPPLIVFFIQAILNRLLRMPAQLVTILSMVLGYFPFFTILGCLPFQLEKGFGFYAYLFLLYSFGAYTYFHLFNMSETSRRIRLLMSVSKQTVKTENEVNEMFEEKEMIAVRLERLQSLRQIHKKQDRYFSTGHLLAAAGFFMYSLSRLFNKPWEPVQRYLNPDFIRRI